MQHFLWMLHSLIADLGNVYQPFQVLIQSGKSPELGQMRDRAFDQLSFFQCLHVLDPGVFLKLADRKTNPLPFAIDTDDLDLDLLSNREHFPGMFNPVPGNFR